MLDFLVDQTNVFLVNAEHPATEIQNHVQADYRANSSIQHSKTKRDPIRTNLRYIDRGMRLITLSPSLS